MPEDPDEPFGSSTGERSSATTATTAQDAPAENKNAHFWNLDYYKPYFDVTTTEMVHRLKCALWPFREDHIFAHGRFDFYGPFWIMVTLNVCVTICGNMVHYIKWAQSDA